METRRQDDGRRYGTVNGVFAGVFRRGTYGYMDALGYSLSVSSVSDLKLIEYLGLPPSTLDQGTRSRRLPLRHSRSRRQITNVRRTTP